MNRRLALLFTALFLATSLPASAAHTLLVSSNPPSGSTLKIAPHRVTLTFNEPLLVVKGAKPNSISVSTANGLKVPAEAVVVRKNVISLVIKDFNDSVGRIKVSYRVVSADGHPVIGSYFFTIK